MEGRGCGLVGPGFSPTSSLYSFPPVCVPVPDPPSPWSSTVGVGVRFVEFDYTIAPIPTSPPLTMIPPSDVSLIYAKLKKRKFVHRNNIANNEKVTTYF